MKLARFLMVLIFIAGLSVMFSAEARADTGANIVYQEMDLGGGLWQYDYTFYNTSDSESLYKVFLDFDSPVTVTGSSLPYGWVGVVWDGTYTTTFMDTMSIYSSEYIAANSFEDGFSFTVDSKVGDIGWYAEFRDTTGGLSNLTGATVVVPEPVSTILFITGGAVMAARKRFRRKREIA